MGNVTPLATGLVGRRGTPRKDLTPRQHKFAEDNIVFNLAGPAAERQFAHDNGYQDVIGNGNGQDFHNAGMLAVHIPDLDLDSIVPFMDGLIRRTEILVEKYWPEIIAVADALMDRERLDYHALLNIVKTQGESNESLP